MSVLAPENEADGPLRTYGRSVGKSLSPKQKHLFADHYPRLAPPLSGEAAVYVDGVKARSFEKIVLEIGFGGGEHLLARAKQSPDVFFIGVEPFLNGVIKAIDGVVSQEIENVAIYRGDVRDLLSWLPENSLSLTYMLYPDPWPKKRHNKRRLLNGYLLNQLFAALEPGCQLKFASDIEDYVAWTLFEVQKNGRFTWMAEGPEDWKTPWAGWPGTRYEAKAIREGRTPHYLSFQSVKK